MILVTLIVKKENNSLKSIKLIMAWDQRKMEKDLPPSLIILQVKWLPNLELIQQNKECNSNPNFSSLKEMAVNVDKLISKRQKSIKKI